MELFEVRNLLKVYDKTAVLNIDNLSIAEGGVVALVGENGSGKTTLLEILLDLNKCTSGEVYYDGELINGTQANLEKLRREVAYVMQSPLLFNYSVTANIEYGMKLRKVEKPERRAKAMEIIEKFKLTGLAGRGRNELSGGEKQRVAVARAVVTNPRVLIMDEHVANVDKKNIHLINDLVLEKSRNGGMTVILTAHHPSQVEGLADRIILIDDGRVIEDSAAVTR